MVARPPVLDALSVVLPTAEETSLLRVCLSSDERSRQSWAQWQRLRTDGANSFLGDSPSVKKLWPLVYEAVRRYGLEVDKESQTYLRSARLKEELRINIFRRVCVEVLQLLQKGNVPTIVLKGVALAETVYNSPVLRHCHDIDLLIEYEDLNRAEMLLRSIGFKRVDQTPDPEGDDCKLEHESGLLLELHSRLFDTTLCKERLSEVWGRSKSCVIAGVQARILSPADNLFHVCGHAFYSSSRQSLQWVCDASLIIDRHRDLNWGLLLDCAERTHLALPLAVTLGYLAENLNVPVPATFLDSLFAAAAKITGIERELTFFRARTSSQEGLGKFLRKARGWRGKALLIQWMIFPSPTYLSRVEGICHSRLCLCITFIDRFDMLGIAPTPNALAFSGSSSGASSGYSR